jgi:hemolysin activation/secretion protein
LILVTEAPANQLYAVAQNANSEALGPWGGVVAAQAIGLTPLYERSTLGVYLAEDGEKQRALQFSSEALLTKGGLKARVEAAYAESAPGGPLEPLDIAGETTFISAELSGPVVVRRGFIGTWRVGLESVDQLTDLFGNTPLNKDSLRIGVVGARADGLAMGGVWNAAIDLRKGIEGLGANSRGDANLSRPDGDPQAFTVRAEAGATRAVTKTISVRANVRGQWADQPLLAFEEFNFGALSGGRGFDPGAVTGDRGVALGFEGAYRTIPLGEKFRIQPYAFVEGARAWGEGLGPSRAEGASAGVGARFEWAQRVRVDVNFAEPFSGPRNVARGSFGSKFGVQISSAVDWTFQNGFGRKVK